MLLGKIINTRLTLSFYFRTAILQVAKYLSILLCLWYFFLNIVCASEPDFVRESIRARGMGNAFTAAANDEMVLFYNPAGLRSLHYNIYQILIVL